MLRLTVHVVHRLYNANYAVISPCFLFPSYCISSLSRVVLLNNTPCGKICRVIVALEKSITLLSEILLWFLFFYNQIIVSITFAHPFSVVARKSVTEYPPPNTVSGSKSPIGSLIELLSLTLTSAN